MSPVEHGSGAVSDSETDPTPGTANPGPHTSLYARTSECCYKVTVEKMEENFRFLIPYQDNVSLCGN